MFNVIIVDELDKSRTRKNNRLAVRGLIVGDDKRILMLKSNLGDYRVPGGAVEDNEKLEEALEREIAEELGYSNIRVIRYLGKTTRIKNDKFYNDSTIEMVNHYFLCKIDKSKNMIKENIFSIETNMQIEWVYITEALENNKQVYERYKNKEPWMRNAFPIFNEIIKECKELV